MVCNLRLSVCLEFFLAHCKKKKPFISSDYTQMSFGLGLNGSGLTASTLLIFVLVLSVAAAAFVFDESIVSWVKTSAVGFVVIWCILQRQYTSLRNSRHNAYMFSSFRASSYHILAFYSRPSLFLELSRSPESSRSLLQFAARGCCIMHGSSTPSQKCIHD